jgi:enoyl-CoA hydratase/carnithine racemase
VVLLGVSPAVSAPTLGPRIGLGGARARLLYPGLVRAAEAMRWGLISELADDPEAVDGSSRRLATRLAAKPRAALRATKSWMNAIDGAETCRSASLEASLALAGGAEERELLAAYWTKRRIAPPAGPGPE